MSRIVGVSEAAALGLHAMACLANRAGEPASVAAMAELLKASANHLSKVLQRLARGGLVRSVRGPAGGFVLAREPEQITLLDVYEQIDGQLDSAACLFGLPVCSGRECILGGLLADANEQVRTHLAQTSLADLEGLVVMD